MNLASAIPSRPERIPIPIFGVPFDPVTATEAIQLVERMIASRQPHYAVTANVDFVVQAQSDLELRRILFDADLVLCDGTPLIWVSRLLGRPLPERVAGSDIVPILLEVAARKRYRVFLLGATPESALRAVENLRKQHPDLPVVGHYSPPFRKLLEMDHVETAARIRAAAPDLLLVSFGCPKQEKWVAMHFRSLGVPVSIGVGATIDFLAGQVKRAPAWMQRSGTEWVYRLCQEPRRLFKRYTKDLCVFGWSVIEQTLRFPPRSNKRRRAGAGPHLSIEGDLDVILLPDDLRDLSRQHAEALVTHATDSARHCVVDCARVRRFDPGALGLLVRLQKVVRNSGRVLVLLHPTTRLRRALEFLRVDSFFATADDVDSARRLVAQSLEQRQAPVELSTERDVDRLVWRGEITAANAQRVWSDTRTLLTLARQRNVVIDLSRVHFLDSSGVDVMLRARKLAMRAELSLSFANLKPEVWNVLRHARAENEVLAPLPRQTTRRLGFPELPQARPA